MKLPKIGSKVRYCPIKDYNKPHAGYRRAHLKDQDIYNILCPVINVTNNSELNSPVQLLINGILWWVPIDWIKFDDNDKICYSPKNKPKGIE
jgi:hypothetical protein